MSEKKEKVVAVYASEEEAQNNRPTGEGADKLRLFAVTVPGGQAAYVWGRDHTHVIGVVARANGYRASKVGKPVAKEDVAAALSRLSPEDRAILIAQYTPAPAPSGKGKK